MYRMNDMSGLTAVISPVSPSPKASETEKLARERLCLNTQADTDYARSLLRSTPPTQKSAEWYFLTGVCAVRQGYMVDAQAHLAHACALDQAACEYDALYESLRNRLQDRIHSDEEGKSRGNVCGNGCDGVNCCDCWNLCDCCEGGCDVCDCCDGGCDGCDCS